ncbi:L,D-transpeptidase family protein [Novosphingobium mangrovi (ex Huang et al. 2023)]|uniref:L,D-transpeptidase family protein n=1 Tax=Novosphingobium mangrovi (ex Huang et al. 2023) TaxID=2976432 RepID=A0ABT2HZH6_9SPHN|nr:L,D-transpeptidase family protein [Novosphingobium mangrovi (ex Huang et al. 2023)]MCT2397951.1 L,D-transpeptidase family protein [Novosphingobium mangrovi (ex Huang et al. 2023)]
MKAVFNVSSVASAPWSVLFLLGALVSCGATNTSSTAEESATVVPQVPAEGWNSAELDELLRWAHAAPEDALPEPDIGELDASIANGDQAAIDSAATALALELAHMHLLGVATTAQRTGWRIEDSDASIDLASRLTKAVADGGIDAFFTALRPSNPDYAALRQAYATETDPARRETIARNMERWRWLPQSLGSSYVLVNTATFEARLWRDGKMVGSWPVIVGKRSTPSPVFSTTITGVVFNPWWEIPASIVREKKGRFPARLGYVRTPEGRYRQKPGPNNALGQMKLVMPNPFRVYMHDTPSKSLFEKDVRAFSHGCIRVGGALDYATTLLDGKESREQVDAIVASRKTTTVSLPRPVPVYITYFTAGLLGDGSFVVMPDIYDRDARIGPLAQASESECSASG